MLSAPHTAHAPTPGARDELRREGSEGWLRWCAHPLGSVVCRAHAQYPAFTANTLFLLQALQKWKLGFLVSSYLLRPEFAPTAYALGCF